MAPEQYRSIGQCDLSGGGSDPMASLYGVTGLKAAIIHSKSM